MPVPLVKSEPLQPRPQQGFALITALLVSLVITLVVIAASQQARQQVRIAQQLEDKLQARLLADNLIQEALYQMATKPRTASGLNVAGKLWNFHGQPVVITPDLIGYEPPPEQTPGLSVIIQDTTGLIPVFAAPQGRTLQALLEHLDVPSERAAIITDSLKDWVDEDNLRRLQGAEREYYQERGLPEPRNAYLQSIDELLMVREMDLEIHDRLKPFLTLYSSGYINPAVAPVPVIQALFGQTAAEQVARLRAAGMTNANALFQSTGIRESEQVMVLPGSVVRITAQATLGEATAERTIVVNLRSRGQKPFTVQESY